MTHARLPKIGAFAKWNFGTTKVSNKSYECSHCGEEIAKGLPYRFVLGQGGKDKHYHELCVGEIAAKYEGVNQSGLNDREIWFRNHFIKEIYDKVRGIVG